MKKMRSGGRHQNRDGEGRGGKGAGGQVRIRQCGSPKQSNGSKAFCICVKCGHQEPHQQGMPCMNQRCPECGQAMTRQ